MGNFHCTTKDCARVVYQVYLSSVVRYKYEGEDWQEIEGDSYAIEDSKSKYDLNERKNYKIYAKAIVSARVPPASSGQPPRFVEGQEIEVNVGGVFSAPIYDVQPVVNGKNVNTNVTYTKGTGGNQQYTFCEKVTQQWTLYTQTNGGNVRIKKDGGSYYEPPIDLVTGLYDLRFEEIDDAKPCAEEIEQNCTFRVFKGSEEKGLTTVLEIVRDTCPEAEVVGCRLSGVDTEIKIKKVPYIETVRVLPHTLVAFGANIYRGPIPDECLAVFKDYTSQILPLPGGFPAPNNGALNQDNTFGLVEVICSYPGCPRPEYQVICNCNEECPPGTCEVRCGDKICCYGDDGVSQKSIPLSSFFPSNTRG